MSRHRNVRSMNYEDECYDEDDDYSRSFEDNYCISPSTAAQFTWNRERNMNFASCMGEGVINEVEEEIEPDDDDSARYEPVAEAACLQLDDTDQARINSCLDEIRAVLGDGVPESIIKEVVRKNQFNLETSLNELLTQQDAPKAQREPRTSRHHSQDDSDDINQLNNLLNEIQNLESLTQQEYSVPRLLRFKSNPGVEESGSNIISDNIPSSSLLVTTNVTEKYKGCCENLNPTRSEKNPASFVSSEIKHKEKPSPRPSLADLANQSKIKTSTPQSYKTELPKGPVTNTSGLDLTLSKALNKGLKFDSKDIKNSHSAVKLSLSDLAKKHGVLKPICPDNASVPYKNPETSQISNKSSDVEKRLFRSNEVKHSTLSKASKVSLSDLATQHKTSLSTNRDLTIGSMEPVIKTNKVGLCNIINRPKLNTKGTTTQNISINSATQSLSKLSLTSCLRSKRSVEPKVINIEESGLSIVNDVQPILEPDEYSDVSILDSNPLESIDISLISKPSNSGIALCKLSASKASGRVKRKSNYPDFKCHVQVKRRCMYPDIKLHTLSVFNFKSLSPDDIVKQRQKRAFSRSDKEFNVGIPSVS